MPEPSRGPLNSLRLGASIASIAAEVERRDRYIRVIRASMLMFFTLGVGTWGFDALTEGTHTWVESLYMTVITVSTVGFTEVIPIDSDALRGFTMVLVLFGGGAMLYFITAVAAVVVEGDLVYRFWRRRLLGRLDRQRGHVVVAGLGYTGVQAVRDLSEARAPFVVVDADPARIEAIIPEFGEDLLFVVGDAFEGSVLRMAGIERAKGLVSALPGDRDNVLVCVTARELNSALRMVSKVRSTESVAKFEQVGVHDTVAPAAMGGARLATVLLHPETVALADAMLDSAAHKLTLCEVEIAEGSEVAGGSLEEARLGERTGCTVLGLRYMDDGPFRYNPTPDSPLVPTGSVMALGRAPELRKLRRLLGPAPWWRRLRGPRAIPEPAEAMLLGSSVERSELDDELPPLPPPPPSEPPASPSEDVEAAHG